MDGVNNDEARAGAPAEAPRAGRVGRLSGFQVLLIACLLVASAAAALAAYAVSHDQADARRAERVGRAQAALGQQVEQAQGALLGVRGLFAADSGVTQDEFARFAEPTIGRGGLQALFASEPVLAAERAAFEQRTGTRIKTVQLFPRPSLRDAGPRDVYHPATLIAPQSDTVGALVNLDLGAIPGVVDAFAAARDAGRIVAARPFALGEASPALFLVGARYLAGAPVATVEQRRAALVGYTGAFYRAAGFARAALGTLPPGASLQIFDGERQIFGPSGTLPDAAGATVDVGGRPWRLRLDVASTPALALPATLLGGGMLLTLLVGLFLATGNRRERDLAEAEAKLRRQASVTSALLDAAPDGIMLVDLNGMVLVQNPAMGRLVEDVHGAPVEGSFEAQAEAVATQFADPEAFLAVQRSLLADPALVREDEYETAGGQILRQFSAPVRMTPGDGPIAARIVVVRDVTVERRMDRMKDEFIALASHELRTPLTSIIGYLEALREGDAGELLPEQERFLEVIARNGQRLRHLVDDLLDVARADAGKLDLDLAEVDLGTVVREAAQAARPAAEEKGIALDAEAAAAALVSGDRTRLAQVVDNLVSNALKFTPPGGTVTVRAVSCGGEVVCEVADTGVGIPAAEQGRLFERFYRASRSDSDAVQGTGLGLAISKMIVEAHGGRIELESEAGLGTRVRVALPAVAPAPAEPAPVGR
jgi:signal transduction histidine kinase